MLVLANCRILQALSSVVQRLCSEASVDLLAISIILTSSKMDLYKLAVHRSGMLSTVVQLNSQDRAAQTCSHVRNKAGSCHPNSLKGLHRLHLMPPLSAKVELLTLKEDFWHWIRVRKLCKGLPSITIKVRASGMRLNLLMGQTMTLSEARYSSLTNRHRICVCIWAVPILPRYSSSALALQICHLIGFGRQLQMLSSRNGVLRILTAFWVT
jgi:hypothetical protein